MKSIKKVLLFVVLFYGSCTGFKVKDLKKVQGKYYFVKDNGKGSGITARKSGLVSDIYFKDSFCYVNYLDIIKYKGDVLIDSNKIIIDTHSEIGTLMLTITNDSILDGEGLAGGIFKKR